MRNIKTLAAWEARDLKFSNDWCFEIAEAERKQLSISIKSAFDEDRELFSYSPSEFDFGPSWSTISKAIEEGHHGKGLSIVRGLPREDLSHEEFRLLSWAIGLRTGVARPQGLS